MTESLLGLVLGGELEVVIDTKFALKDAVAAHAHAESRSVFGRIVMLPKA